MQPVNSDICKGRNDMGCGGIIFPVKMEGRYFLYKDVWILLPSDLQIPRCDKCKVDWLDFETEAALDVILEREYHEHIDLITEARARHEVRA